MMSSKSRQIREAIQTIAGVRQALIFTAEVVSVNGKLCEVKHGTLQLTDVRLVAVEGDSTKNILITPVVGSIVLVADLGTGEKRDLAVIQYSEIESIAINGGSLGGLVKIEELKNNIDSLKQYVESIHAALPAAFSAIGAGTAAAGSAGATSYNTAMTGKSISIEDMEDTTVKH
jgi:hypothetical protein